MKRLFAKKYSTVIMDGSDANVVRTIIDAIDIVTNERYGESVCHNLDSNHPTIKVIETYTNERTYRKIRGMIERSYPGLCAFDVFT